MTVDWWAVAALIVMLVGLAGIFLPVVPGVALIWLAAVGYAVIDGFTRIGPLTLVVLTGLGVLGVTAELWVSSLGGKVSGASWWSLLAGLVLGLIGLVFFSVPGAVIGAALGVLAMEAWRREGDWREALRASSGWLIGWLFSIAVQLFIGMVMIAIFLWRVL
ncbi:MAG: DUF456 domain-containing protein [Anaerolineae bacterium]|nr:DUF456 domain-containing protein [Anaerolineae bacterium]